MALHLAGEHIHVLVLETVPTSEGCNFLGLAGVAKNARGGSRQGAFDNKLG